MSIAGGVQKALQRAASIPCEVVQIFTKNQLRWAAPPLREEEIRVFRKRRGEFKHVLAHASYLINLASPDERVYGKSVCALEQELDRCHALGIPALVLHPGYHLGLGEDRGIERLAKGVRSAYEGSGRKDVLIALETTAGRGSSLGASFEQLKTILSAVEADGFPVGICFDTCHVFAAGYELRNRSGYDSTWREFDRIIGRRYLIALHLNDSKGGIASGKDRHEHIGKGRIGLPGFRLLAQDPRLLQIPGILETPKGRDMREDVENLRILRSLTSRTSESGS
jgi:deoxyribonuclease-4